MPVAEVLDAIRAISTSESEKGRRFEQLMKTALQTDRTYRDRFSNVWLWMEWLDRGLIPDIGIDLVAELKGGGYAAIQCKFYDPQSTLTKENIDSFFTASGRQPFTERIIIATTDRWSPNAEKAIQGQHIPVIRLGIDDLDAMTVDWQTLDPRTPTTAAETMLRSLLPHQQTAVEKVRAGFQEVDRGQLIMACGTGKTFTSLRIAEEHAGVGKAVLFLAPSIALVSQALKEWTAETGSPIRPYAVCSDATTGRALEGENAAPYDLPIPATTDHQALVVAGAGSLDPAAMTVIFSTYQSSEVIAELQTATGLVFDLVICDEAHRTAGATREGEDQSAFLRVHDDDQVPARKRLYMTATPKVYKLAAQEDARDADAILASMDDPETFGPEFHRLGFGEAVEQGLLADYRVLILTVSEEAVSQSFQNLLSTHGGLNLPDVAKYVGCLSGLAKQRTGGTFSPDDPHMKRAVAFWSTIAESEQFADQFDLVAEHYNEQRTEEVGNQHRVLAVPTRHVDGTTNISRRREDIRWLKGSPPDGECRVLTNARCLTEGVDVPALDAVMFLKPRRSKIDIVQAVGRVMRKPEGKNIGYIILPIAVPPGQDPAAALNRNPDYDVVWDVLQALRAHDERFNAYINRIALRDPNDPYPDGGHIEIINATPDSEDEAGLQGELFDFEEWSGAIYTKIVSKVGTRTYWEDWASDVAAIADRNQARIDTLLSADSGAEASFDTFLGGLRMMLNDSITREDAIAMLSQHMITRPIFEAIFGTDSFTTYNPISQAMQAMVTTLEAHNLDTETASLDRFYDSVRRRVEGIPTNESATRQRIIKELYGRFFKIAFPTTAASLGIVYTPVEVVDFIIRATQAALGEHFDGASLSDPDVHIIDPFTGTGTFITRLLQSGYIAPEALTRKYAEEIHANELLLLAYYIAAVNVETVFHDLAQPDDYTPFPGIVLTDTFQLAETGEGASLDVFPVNNERAERQRTLPIRVIMGNPPYSAGQTSANDDNPNLAYTHLDSTITNTYAARSTARNKNSLYDSYIRAIRWASNRILPTDHGGVVAFVTNGGYIDGNSADGLRLTLADEYHHIYIYNLRGNARTSGGQRQKEAGNVFESGSRATVAVMILVKKPDPVAPGSARIHYRDIGDYLSRGQKLEIVDTNLRADPPALDDINWTLIQPNQHGDWLNQRSESYASLFPVHSDDEPSIFQLRTNGLQTNRDAWNYNSSRATLITNTERMVEHYNRQVAAFEVLSPEDRAGRAAKLDQLALHVADLDPQKFSWDRADFRRMRQGVRYSLQDAQFMEGTYRPFHRRNVNNGRRLNKETSQLSQVYPTEGAENLVIGVAGKGGSNPFTPFITDSVPDLVMVGAGNAMHFFPRFVYPRAGLGADPNPGRPDLLSALEDTEEGLRSHNVTTTALRRFQCLDAAIEHDDVFFYVYGIFHSPQYRTVFAADLKKSLPRVPEPPGADSFWAFSRAGRNLAHLHAEYETLDAWPTVRIEHQDDSRRGDPHSYYRVERMRYPRMPETSARGGIPYDKTTIMYNAQITIRGIPIEAHTYILGSRSAIDWVVENSQIKRDKASGIVNDPNDWCIEHENPTYLLDLVGQVVTVSMRTLEIIDSLPELDM